MLAIAFSLPRTFGAMIGDRRQGRAIVAVTALIATGSAGQNPDVARFPWEDPVPPSVPPRPGTFRA